MLEHCQSHKEGYAVEVHAPRLETYSVTQNCIKMHQNTIFTQKYAKNFWPQFYFYISNKKYCCLPEVYL